jgi:DNA-binding CsgD family transcriptional regulator
MRRGYTNSEIARRMQISQEQVDTIIREIRDAGA